MYFRFFYLLLLTLLISLLGCKESLPTTNKTNTPLDTTAAPTTKPITISAALLKDKVLGMLVGAAIGDAMGAPTEMWRRSNIQTEYGWVQQLDDMVRTPSPEGTWQMN